MTLDNDEYAAVRELAERCVDDEEFVRKLDMSVLDLVIELLREVENYEEGNRWPGDY